MSFVLSQSGTTSALTIGSETTLGSADTNNAIFQSVIDTTNMALGDILEIRVYTINLSGDSLALAYKGTYQHVQGAVLKATPPLASDLSYSVTLKQTAGTGRTYKWKILRQ